MALSAAQQGAQWVSELSAVDPTQCQPFCAALEGPVGQAKQRAFAPSFVAAAEGSHGSTQSSTYRKAVETAIQAAHYPALVAAHCASHQQSTHELAHWSAQQGPAHIQSDQPRCY